MKLNDISLAQMNSVFLSISLIIIAGIFIIILPVSFLGSFQLLIVGVFMVIGYTYTKLIN